MLIPALSTRQFFSVTIVLGAGCPRWQLFGWQLSGWQLSSSSRPGGSCSVCRSPKTVSPTCFYRGSSISFKHVNTFSYRLFPVVVRGIRRNLKFLLLRIVLSRPHCGNWQLGNVRCVSASSTTREYVVKPTSWSFRLVESCWIRSATVFPGRLTLESSCLFL